MTAWAMRDERHEFIVPRRRPGWVRPSRRFVVEIHIYPGEGWVIDGGMVPQVVKLFGRDEDTARENARAWSSARRERLCNPKPPRFPVEEVRFTCTEETDG